MNGVGRGQFIAAAFACVGGIALIVWLLFSSGTGDPPVNQTAPVKFASDKPPIRFKWQFEGAPKMTLRQVGEDHYAISFPHACNYFIFKVEGAIGRTVRFSFTGIPAQHWEAIRPVCGYPPARSSPSPGTPGEGRGEGHGGVTDLDEVAFYENDEHGKSHWSYIEQMDRVSDSEIAYTHKFEKDSAYVALRVPYTLGYQQNWLAKLPKQKGVEVIEIGKSAEGRPLTLIKVGRGDEQAEKENPCILMYAREHPDEPDSSWVAQGALRFVASDTSEAKELRNRFTFLFIPMLDPDGWGRGVHESMYETFLASRATPESIAYAEWFEKWVDASNRLDVALNLHNPEPRDYPHLMGRYMENEKGRLKDLTSLNESILSNLDKQFLGRTIPRSPGWMMTRLGGWLGYYYGPLPLLYEVNSQAPNRRLDLVEMRALAAQLVSRTAEHVDLQSGREAMAGIDQMRVGRSARIATSSAAGSTNALTAAEKLQWTVIALMENDQRNTELSERNTN